MSNRVTTPDVSLCHASDSESSASAAGPDRLNVINDMAIVRATVADDSNVRQMHRLVVDEQTLGQEMQPSLTVMTMEPVSYSRRQHRYNHHSDGSGADSIGLSSYQSGGSEFSLGEAEPQHPRVGRSAPYPRPIVAVVRRILYCSKRCQRCLD